MSASDRDDEERAARPGLVERMRALFGLGGVSIRDDIQDALQDTSGGGDFSSQERLMLRNVLGLHELRVDDILVPRADIIAVGVDATLGEVLGVFRTAGHSRLPVHGDALDDPRGMVHIRDLVDYLAAAAEAALPLRRRKSVKSQGGDDDPAPAGKNDLASMARFEGFDLSQPLSDARIVRPVLFVPPSMPVLDLLVKMQAMRTHMALVIDEYGGTEGLVSIEDIVETMSAISKTSTILTRPRRSKRPPTAISSPMPARASRTYRKRSAKIWPISANRRMS